MQSVKELGVPNEPLNLTVLLKQYQSEYNCTKRCELGTKSLLQVFDCIGRLWRSDRSLYIHKKCDAKWALDLYKLQMKFVFHCFEKCVSEKGQKDQNEQDFRRHVALVMSWKYEEINSVERK